MQAIGVLLFEKGNTVIRGERRPARIKEMHLPKGNEAVYSFLEPARREGAAGTQVRVESRRPGSKSGDPGHSWSLTVLDKAGCLLELLDVTPPPANAPRAREVDLPAGTPLTLLLRRFVFSTDLRVNQRLEFTVASEVKSGGEIVIPRGALAIARVKSTSPAEDWGKGAKASIAFEYVYAAGGAKLPIRGNADVSGAGTSKLRIGLAIPGTPFDPAGHKFALPAGTPFQVTVAADQKVRLRGPE